MVTKIRFGIFLALVAVPISAQEVSYSKSMDDVQLDKSIRSGNVESMREAEQRRHPVNKASLEWVAEHYEEHIASSYSQHVEKDGSVTRQILYPEFEASSQQDAREIERLTRNNAKVELAKWGEKKYFDEFVADLSTSNLQIQSQAMDCLMRINNMAALKYLIALVDNPAIIPTGSRDALPQSVGLSAAATIQRIVISNTGKARMIQGADYKDDDDFRAHWKKWWHDNRTRYGNIAFENGWLNESSVHQE